ncbi:MAG: hypothetical protein D3915_13520 [Candidatus Electrothrix sp. AU1_5]|nr:hypothetical protein [Candidatus Electrothrix gigas]
MREYKLIYAIQENIQKEVEMSWLTRGVSIAVLSALLVLSNATQGRTQSFEVIFVDSLWGAAVGGIAGLSIGLLIEDDDDEVFSKYMVKGMGAGALGGLLYGIFHCPPHYGDIYLNNGQPKGLFHFNSNDNILAIRPGKVIPRQDFDKDLEEANWRFDLFTTSF